MNIVVETERENQAEIREAWARHAPALTKWAYQCLYSRDNAYPAWIKELDDWRCVHKDLTEDVLRNHFHGTRTIGTYTLGRDNKCLYVGWDIDHHDGDPGDPAANWRYARILCRWLTRMGAKPAPGGLQRVGRLPRLAAVRRTHPWSGRPLGRQLARASLPCRHPCRGVPQAA